MKSAVTISMAMALSVAAMVPASAQVAPAVGPAGTSPSAGLWVVGGIGLAVLSVIARAKVVSDRKNRELTADEATQALFLPFLWTLKDWTFEEENPSPIGSATLGVRPAKVGFNEFTIKKTTDSATPQFFGQKRGSSKYKSVVLPKERSTFKP